MPGRRTDLQGSLDQDYQVVVLVRSEMGQRVSFQVTNELRDESSAESFVLRPVQVLAGREDTIDTEEAKRLARPSVPDHRIEKYIAFVEARAVAANSVTCQVGWVVFSYLGVSLLLRPKSLSGQRFPEKLARFLGLRQSIGKFTDYFFHQLHFSCSARVSLMLLSNEDYKRTPKEALQQHLGMIVPQRTIIS